MASTKIQGMVIDIGANTGPLKTAFEAVNKSLSSTQKELNQVSKLLKLDPSNVELLIQKQKLLDDQLTESREKLSKLHDIMQQLEQRSFNGEDVAKEMRAVERESIATEQSISKLTDAFLETTQAVEGLEKGNEKAADAFEDEAKGAESAEKATEKSKKGIKEHTEETDKSAKSLGTMTVAFGNLVSKGVEKLISYLKDAYENTKEFREDFAKLETNVISAGNSIETINALLKDLEFLTGETDSNIEGLSNLLQAGFDDNQMVKIVKELSGAVVKFPDTLKIESLSDSLQETIATKEATGQFAELLERLGYDVELFSSGLQAASKHGEEHEYILRRLSKTGLADVYDLYVKNNAALKEGSDAQFELNQTLSELAEVVGPIVTEMMSTINTVLQENKDAITGLAKIVTAIIVVILELISIIAKIDPTVLMIIVTVISAVTAFLSLTKTVNNAIDTFDKLDIKSLKTTAIIVGVVVALLALAAIIAVIVGRASELKGAMQDVGDSVGDLNSQISGAQSGISYPRYAAGTKYHRGGGAIITEYGAEQLTLPNGSQYVVMPRGTKVDTARQTQGVLSGGDTYYISIDAKNVQEFNDIVRIARNQRQMYRMGYVRG